MELTLIKTVNYKLEPYGKFVIKFKTRQKHIPNIIPIDELVFDKRSVMPMSVEQEKEIIKFMKKHKTDILTDGGYFNFYTRVDGGLAEVRHPKLLKYREDDGFRMAVDNGHSFGAVMLNNL